MPGIARVNWSAVCTSRIARMNFALFSGDKFDDSSVSITAVCAALTLFLASLAPARKPLWRARVCALRCRPCSLRSSDPLSVIFLSEALRLADLTARSLSGVRRFPRSSSSFSRLVNRVVRRLLRRLVVSPALSRMFIESISWSASASMSLISVSMALMRPRRIFFSVASSSLMAVFAAFACCS